MLPLAHPRFWLAGGLLLVAGVLLGSLMPVPVLTQPPGSDKLHHFVAYAALALWFAGMFEPRRQLALAATLVALGGAIELLQAIPALGRSSDAVDLAADSAGVAFGLVAARLGLAGWCLCVEQRLGVHDGR